MQPAISIAFQFQISALRQPSALSALSKYSCFYTFTLQNNIHLHLASLEVSPTNRCSISPGPACLLCCVDSLQLAYIPTITISVTVNPVLMIENKNDDNNNNNNNR